jgi:Ca2+-binding RTX toxin-like protein
VAQVNNVDRVEVDLDGSDDDGDTLTIDNRNGRVTEPGFTQNEIDLNEIEWLIEDVNDIVYEDTEAAGAITIGEYEDGADPLDTPPGAYFDILDPLTGLPDPTPDFVLIPSVCGDGVSDGDTLINMNAFPGDNDADLAECDDEVSGITVNGNGGDDFILGKGGDGADNATSEDLVLNGGEGVDEIEGGEGDDVISGGPGRDVLDGNANSFGDPDCFENDDEGVWEGEADGGDTVDFSGEAGPLVIVMNNDGTLTVSVNPDATVVDFENVIGSAGNDTITGNNQANFLSGGGGNDTISGGNEASDPIASNDPADDGDVILGGDGDDTLAGDDGDDCVIGGAGNDILNENTGTSSGNPGNGNGADALDGGPGLEDVVDYGQRTTRNLIHLGIISWNNDGGDENADSVSEECDDVFFSTENAISGSGNDILSADFLNNQSDNEFTPGAGNDQIEGGAGNDVIHEGAAASGSDAMDGDSGADLVDYSQRSNGVTVSVNDGAGNDGEAGEGDSVGANVVSRGIEGVCGEENEDWDDSFGEPFEEDEANDAGGVTEDSIENVAGGSGGDVLVGDEGANILTGNAGNDNLAGGAGSDVLSGGDGDDILAGNAGNDNLDGGAGTDWVDFQSAGAGGVGVQVNLTTNTATGEGADALTGFENVGGSSFADTIRGDAGNNVLNGRGGNDAIQGSGGDDVVNGGSGHDELAGNGGNDTVRGQSGRDTVRGGGGDDVTKGDGGDDTVFGGAGDDNLAGGAGKDHLRGGPGTDRCQPGAPGLARGDVALGCEA